MRAARVVAFERDDVRRALERHAGMKFGTVLLVGESETRVQGGWVLLGVESGSDESHKPPTETDPA